MHLRIGVMAFAVFLILAALVGQIYPWRPAFDDFDHLAAAEVWNRDGRLVTEPFVRVPLWTIMLGAAVKPFSGAGDVERGILFLQAIILAGFLAIYLRHAKNTGFSALEFLPPLLLFIVSPQLIFYTRHAVNEHLIGTAAAAIFLLGLKYSTPRTIAMGAICGLATMTKIAGAALVLPSLAFITISWPRAAIPTIRNSIGVFLVGFLVAAAPLATLSYLNRGDWMLDNTGAYNLSSLSFAEWRALPDPKTREDVAMREFRDAFAGAPIGYLAESAERTVFWILRPASADLALFYPGLPMTFITSAEVLISSLLLVLALAGTTRRTAPIWFFAIAMTALCAFPRHTPFTPKIAILYPMLMLAPAGIRRVLRKNQERAGDASAIPAG